jgi:SAM-dependent methyltransferase
MAKRSVDDRSINAGVLAYVRRETGTTARRFVEIGGGIGTMVARLYGLGIAVRGEYVLIDEDARMLAEARRYLAGWAAAHGVIARESADGIVLGELAVTLVEAEIGAYSAHSAGRHADVLIGCAVLDVIDVPRLLPGMVNLLKPGGVYWFPITYDGEMAFLPDHVADAALVAAYHADMSRRVRHGGPAGERFAGRHLLEHLRSVGAPVIAAGSADWVVLPGPDGRYPDGESEFVAGILDTIESALMADDGAPAIGRDAVARYLSARREQLARGELVYLAQILDVAGRAPT